jgi:hypothetical protein
MLTPDISPVSIHTKGRQVLISGGYRSENFPTLFTAFPRLLLESTHYRLMESQKLDTFVSAMILTLISTPYCVNIVI